MSRFVLGIDIGGTNIRLGLVSSKGEIIARSGFATKGFIQNKGRLINAVAKACRDLIEKSHLKKKHIKGIGIGLPGLVDTQKGVVFLLPNIPGWKNVRLKKIFEDKLHIPTFIDNDVNLITVGEWKFGAGRGMENMICMTLGTGVGGGLIINNQLYRGEGFSAGELGHVPINENGPHCNCGGRGCFERYVGNRYLQQKAAKVFKREISLEEVTALADRRDSKAVRFWRETAEHIGHGLIGPVNVLNPKKIVIGGGVANAERHLFKTIQDIIRKRAMRIQGRMVKIVRAQLGDNAGIIGTQVLVKHAQTH